MISDVGKAIAASEKLVRGSGRHPLRQVHHRGGSITLPFLLDGQYFRICGSVFNDGLYQYPAKGMSDEIFDGEVWALAVPKAVVALSEEIAAWQDKNGAAADSPYKSESFGGYSYSKAEDTRTGESATWQSVFRSRLHQWRKL